jgi:hypothetical protein
MFFPSSYSFLMFMCNIISEYSYSRAAISSSTYQAITSSPVTLRTGLAEVVASRAISEAMVDKTWINLSRTLRNIVEIVLPISFGTICVMCLFADGWRALRILVDLFIKSL